MGKDFNDHRWPEEAAPHVGLIRMMAGWISQKTAALSPQILQEAGNLFRINFLLESFIAESRTDQMDIDLTK